MNNEGKVTVREAFALAGFPVPEGAKIVYEFPAGMRFIKDYGSQMEELSFEDGFIVSSESLSWGLCAKIAKASPDLSSLPAIDAYDALPEIVRAALPKEDTKR